MSVFLLSLERASLFGLVALALALLVQRLLDGRVPASWRVWVWRVALLQTALALAPVSPLRFAVLPPPPSPVSASTPNSSASFSPLAQNEVSSHYHSQSVTPPVQPAAEMPDSPVPMTSAQKPPVSTASIMLAACAFGVAIQLLLLARCFGRVRASLRDCQPVQAAEPLLLLQDVAQRMQISPVPRLLKSEISSPCLVGIVRPAIVLPSSFLTLQEPELEAIFSHELAHQKRRDLAWNAILWLVQALLWFHPLVPVDFCSWKPNARATRWF